MKPENRKNFEITLRSFQASFASLIAQSKSANGNSEELDGAGSIEIYTRFLNDPFVIVNAWQAIEKYINFYRVEPADGIYDEFKLIYFLAKSITTKLDASGLSDTSKIHQRATLMLLDHRLQCPYAARRSQLSRRIVYAINNNKVNEHFGEYGLYLTYKCLFNAAKDNAEKDRALPTLQSNWT